MKKWNSLSSPWLLAAAVLLAGLSPATVRAQDFTLSGWSNAPVQLGPYAQATTSIRVTFDAGFNGQVTVQYSCQDCLIVCQLGPTSFAGSGTATMAVRSEGVGDRCLVDVIFTAPGQGEAAPVEVDVNGNGGTVATLGPVARVQPARWAVPVADGGASPASVTSRPASHTGQR
jgi:hypothetical protein